MKRRAKWPNPGVEGKVNSFSVFDDCNGGEDDQTQNPKNLEMEKSMFRDNILALRNARQPLNNLLHSATLPVDAIN